MRMTLGHALKLVVVSGLIAAPLIVQVSLQTLDDPPPSVVEASQLPAPDHQPVGAGPSSYQTATR